MYIAICDDDLNFRKTLENHLNSYFSERQITISVTHFSCGEDLISCDTIFDLIFLDVEMANINGIQTGKIIKKKCPRSIVFIITAFDQYLDDAFSINAFWFLCKPLNVIRLYHALDCSSDYLKNVTIVFYDINRQENIPINIKNIIYIEIKGKKTKIVTVDETYYSNEKLTFWKERLNTFSFAHPHASFIANLDYTINHTRSLLVLGKKNVDGELIEQYNIPISPKNQAEIKQQFFYVLERR